MSTDKKQKIEEVSWQEALARVRAAVRENKGRWSEICTGAKVGYHWLRRLSEEGSESPDTFMVARVAEFLGLPITFSMPREPVASRRQGTKAPSSRSN